MHGKGLPQSMSFPLDWYSRELAGMRFSVGESSHTQQTRLCSCARRVLEAERDFQVEALGPRFHCELNFIECCWCRAKWFTRLASVKNNNQGPWTGEADNPRDKVEDLVKRRNDTGPKVLAYVEAS